MLPLLSRHAYAADFVPIVVIIIEPDLFQRMYRHIEEKHSVANSEWVLKQTCFLIRSQKWHSHPVHYADVA